MSFPSSLDNGRFLLVKPLGEGGMATVFLAFDQRLEGWRAAKLLAPQYANKPKLRARFEHEARLMEQLKHKNIVRVYDVGREGDSAYIIMELLEGGSLVDWLEEHGPMPARLAVRVTLQICEGIAAAHEKGVVHRDIKPHNVLVASDGLCQVTDFGIARVADTSSTLTKTGAVMGTWGYMAPEQRKDAKDVDGRADLYATAATLYTLLTNRVPMDLFAADRDATMLEGLPRELLPILAKATAYRPEERQESVVAFAKELALLHDSLPEDPPETPALARPPGEPRPIPAPEEYEGLRAAQTDYSLSGGGEHPTLLPVDGVGTATRGTIVVDDRPVQAPTVPPTDGVTPPAVNLRQLPTIDPSIESTGLPMEPQARRGSGVLRKIGFAAALLLAVFGVAEFGAAAIIYAHHESTGALAQVAPPVVPDQPASPPPAVNEGTSTAPVASVTEAVAAAPAVTRTEKTPSRSRSSTNSGTNSGTNSRSSTSTSTSTTPPPQDPGTAEPAPEPKVEPKAAPETVAVEQCVRVTPPSTVVVGQNAVFKAMLCREDGSEVTLWFRGIGGTWQSRLMPVALGAHTAKVTVDESFHDGLEFYIQAGTASQGTASQPLSVMVVQ